MTLDLKQVSLVNTREPAKRWRNKWKSQRKIINIETFVDMGSGLIWGPMMFPSKELAENKAQQALFINKTLGRDDIEYLGTFPVEE